MNFSIVCNNSGAQILSLAAAVLLFPCESPLLFVDTSNPPNPLLVVAVVTVVPATDFPPNKLPPLIDPPKRDAKNRYHYIDIKKYSQ